MRVTAWRGDHDALRRWADDDTQPEAPNWRIVRLYAQAIVGVLSDRALRERLQRIFSGTHNPRFLSMAEQLATEIYASRGALEEARIHLVRAATNVLVDLEWIDHCPLLAPLRVLPDWADVRRRVRARAESVWST